MIVFNYIIYNYFEIIEFPMIIFYLFKLKCVTTIIVYNILIGIPERKRCVKYETSVTNPFMLNTEDDYPPSKKGSELNLHLFNCFCYVNSIEP